MPAFGFIPSNRPVATHLLASLLRQPADLLDGCADHLRLDRDADLLALTVGLDAWGRQVVQSYHAGLIGVDRGRLRHRLSLLGACGSQPRALASVVTESGIASPEPAIARAALVAQSCSLAGAGALPTPSQLAAAVANAHERITSGLRVRDMAAPQLVTTGGTESTSSSSP